MQICNAHPFYRRTLGNAPGNYAKYTRIQELIDEPHKGDIGYPNPEWRLNRINPGQQSHQQPWPNGYCGTLKGSISDNHHTGTATSRPNGHEKSHDFVPIPSQPELVRLQSSKSSVVVMQNELCRIFCRKRDGMSDEPPIECTLALDTTGIEACK